MNKKLLILFACFISFFTVQHTYSQCTPDVTITDPGIYPDSATGLPNGTVGVAYNQTIQARVLTDTTFQGLPVVITSIEISSVSGLPPGLSYACNPASCVFPGGSNGCISLSGVPTTVGVYGLTVELTINGTIFGIPAPAQTATVDYYTITINSNVGIGENVANLKFDLAQNTPNPFSEYSQLSFTTPVNGDFTLKVFNLLGKEVFRQMLRAQAGVNVLKLEAKDFLPGVYMYTLENGTATLTRRMMVSRK